MIAVPPPPPMLPQMENAVVTYLERHGFSFPARPDLTVIPPPPKIGQGPLAGILPIAYAGSNGHIFVSSDLKNYHRAHILQILLHETLHETVTGGSSDYRQATPEQQLATEQATDAMTLDLLPGLLKALGVRAVIQSSYGEIALHPIASAYTGLVKRLRVASSKACHAANPGATYCGWNTPWAREWRADQFFTPALERRLYR